MPDEDIVKVPGLGRIVRVAMLFAAGLPLESAAPQSPPKTSVHTALDVAIARMGGADALARVERVRFESLTLWHRMTFEQRPFGDAVGSYERHSDLRDYTIPAWRNTRRFVSGAPVQFEIVDVVRDTVAIRYAPTGPTAPAAWAPLNHAYLDERGELFTFAPERLLLAAKRADLKALADTSIDGLAHARLEGVMEGFPTTLFLRRGDGFLAMVRYRAAQPNDFGLAPYGSMEVEMWYSRWTRLPLPNTPGITYPMQWDVRRIGEPYKRITILSARFDAAAPSDSFPVTDSLRRGFVATARKPMWDLPRDSARIVDGRIALLGLPGASAVAVKLGSKWMFFEGATVPERTASDVQWLQSRDPGTTAAGIVVSAAFAARGSVAWFARQRLALYVAPGAQRVTTRILRNWNVAATAGTLVERGRWVRVDGDSLWIEPIQLPGSPGALVAWVPSLRWAYSGAAVTPVQTEFVLEHARQRGWPVERLGSLRTLAEAVAARAATR
ncbi:MAG: hypothetical protein AB1762_05700 [Gemmatimonadota bacterium]